MNEKEKNLVLGAMLHDIGKFLQRAKTDLDKDYKNINCGYSGAHSKWSAGFVDRYLPEYILKSGDEKRILNDIILSHHNKDRIEYRKYKSILEIVSGSDSLSADERKKRDEDDEKGEPEKEFMLSTFCSISSEDKIKKSYYPLLPLNEKLIRSDMFYPQEEGRVMQKQGSGYKEIWREFEKDILKLNRLDLNFGNYINSLNYIFFKYLRFVPSAAFVDIPDISLYDHLKTTTAIALCKYRTENNERPYLLIEGDVSGIQNFIFYAQKDIEAEKGSAKRLRGRSFFINLFVDASVFHILNELDLPEMNVLLQSGGHLIILAPNTKKNKEKVESIRESINKSLYKKYGSILYLAVSCLEGNDDDIKDYAKFREKLSVETEKIKNRKFEELFEELFANKSKEEIPREESSICVVCGINEKEKGKDKHDEEYKICKTCEDLFELGDKIVDCRYILRYIGDGGDFTIEIGDKKINYDFSIKEPKMKGDKPAIYSLNSFDFVTRFNSTQGFKLLGTYVPTNKENKIKTFDEITEPIKGEEHIKLAILKADVDNLGWIFSKGINKELRSISRISTMSFLFDMFFSLYVNELAKPKKEKGHGCYIIFSGGDDLIVAGRFDEVVDFAKNLGEFFNKWVSENPNITISAGIEIAHYKFPVKRLVEYANDALDKSKGVNKCEKCGSEKTEEKPDEGTYTCKNCRHTFISKKDKVTLFERTLFWREFENVLKLIEKLDENEKDLSSGILYQLFDIWQKSNKEITSRKSVIVSPDPYVKYCLVRNWKGKKDEKFEEFEREIIKNFKIMDVVVSLYSLLHRYGLKLKLEDDENANTSKV